MILYDHHGIGCISSNLNYYQSIQSTADEWKFLRIWRPSVCVILFTILFTILFVISRYTSARALVAPADPKDSIEREKLLIVPIHQIRHPLDGIKMNSDLPYYVIQLRAPRIIIIYQIADVAEAATTWRPNKRDTRVTAVTEGDL